MMSERTVSNLLDAFLNFNIPEIPEGTRFWMVRTKKGYFYHEFLTKHFVALAWNIIDIKTDFSDSALEHLNDSILMHYNNIKRPTLVVNKCKSFIHDIKENDILVIPSEGSKYITFAYAGKYYEDESKSYNLEQLIIDKIEHREVQIDDISCPYLKRRHIIPIRTVKNDAINYHLLKAISSYHGISNLDEYGTIIIDHIYNAYIFKNTIRLVYHVSKTDPITSKEFSGFLYSINSILTTKEVNERDISAQASVHSIGDIVFSIKNAAEWLSSNYIWFIAIAVILGGGKFLTVEMPGLPNVIKEFISLKYEKQKNQIELTGLKLENYMKAIELKNKMNESGMTLSELEKLCPTVDTLTACSQSMQIAPLDTMPEIIDHDIIPQYESDNEEESL